MGLIISRFRKKKSTIEILDDIDKQISKLQQFRRQNQERQKKFVVRLILYSIVLYIGAALIFYFYYLPPTWTKRLLYSLPLLIFPVLIWLLKKFLHWYYVKRITKNDLALNELQEEKKKILEDVMEKETYKKAREILQKYDPARFKQLETPATPARASTEGSALRQRNLATTAKQTPQVRPGTPYPVRHQTPGVRMNTPGARMNTPGARMNTLAATPRIPHSAGMRPRALSTPLMNGNFEEFRGPPLPRPILPRERTTLDRVLEYMVGDGPQNRYALICRFCHSHNGMALKEEFEYISFRCCYCYQMNMAKKQRPFAPKLEVPPPSTGVKRQPVLAGTIEEGSDSDDEDEEDSDEVQEEEDKNSDEVQDNSKDSGISNVAVSDQGRQPDESEKGRQPDESVKGRQSELCSQVNGTSTDEEKEIRPS